MVEVRGLEARFFRARSARKTLTSEFLPSTFYLLFLSLKAFPRDQVRCDMIVHLIDGTYELFRHFYGARRFNKGQDKPSGAVLGVLNTVLQMIEEGATHVGVATDHVIESFRNGLWPGYKTGEGVDPALMAQFHPLERALTSMGVRVWAMV